MTNWMFRKPPMLDRLGEASYQPNVGMTFLIAILIYIAHVIASIPAVLIYVFIYFTGIPDLSFAGLVDSVYDMMMSQSTMLFSLFFTVALIVLTIVYVRCIEKRTIVTMGLHSQGFFTRYALGFGLGFVLIVLSSLPWLLTKELTWLGLKPVAGLYLLAFGVQGASEEVFFRGFMMTSILRKIGVVWAVVISSAVFALLHIFNGGMGVISMTALFFVGAFLALIALRTNSLWTACALHAAWNFGSGLMASGSIGGLTMDYAAVRIGDMGIGQDYGIIGDPRDLLSIGLMIAAIALVLFAGKNRLVVRRSPINLS